MNFYTVRNSKFWSFIISSIIEYIFMHLPTTPTKKNPCRVRIEKIVGFKFSFITLSVCSTLSPIPLPPLVLAFHLPPSQRR